MSEMMYYYLTFSPQAKRLWSVQMLFCELLQRANLAKLQLERIMRALVWEGTSWSSGFAKPLCFGRSLSSVTLRSSHTDPLLCQY